MIEELKKWHLKLKIYWTIKSIQKENILIPKEKEEEMKDVIIAFEKYKKDTIKRIEEIYEKYCDAVSKKL